MTFVLISCDDGPNSDALEETSCEEATGTWVVSDVACNGESLGASTFSAIVFNTSSSAEWLTGSADCQQRSTNVARQTVPQLSLVGTSFYQCESDGSPVGSCSGVQQSCSSSQAADGRVLDFSVCVVENVSRLRLNRTVTDDLIAQNQNFCPDSGQEEEITYVRAVEGEAAVSFSNQGFVNILPNEVQTSTITILNSGTLTATGLIPSSLNSPFRYVGGSYPGTNGNCGSTIPRTSSCTIEVEFAPTAVGSFSDTLALTYNNGVGVVTSNIALTGVAEQPIAEIVMVDPALADFGSITTGSSANMTIRFENQGTGVASSLSMVGLAAPFSFTGGSYPGTGGTCGSSLGVGSDCTVEVTFSPGAAGFFAGTLRVVYNDGVLGQLLDVPISGRGL